MNVRILAMAAACIVLIGAVWLLLGSRIVLMVDRMFPGAASPQEVGDILINADSFISGARKLPLPRWDAFELKVALDRRKRLVLSANGHAFTLGPVKKMWDDKPEAQYLFVPEAGDVVVLTRDVSRFGWQTPFAFSFVGSMPRRHRYEYDRLRWRKSSGARLEITWRDEQGFSGGWQDEHNSQLTSVTVHVSAIEKAAADYLRSAKGWKGVEYRLEAQAPTAESDVVEAVDLADGAVPGGGKSVVLHISRSTGRVSETGWQ